MLLGEVECPIVKPDDNVPERYYQACECKNDENMNSGNVNADGIRTVPHPLVSFCYCCSTKLINTDSKYSPFYCDDCMRMVLDFNNMSKQISLPVGRHSFMNGIGLISPYTKREEMEYQKELETFFKGIRTLREWQKFSLFENLHALGFDFKSDITLLDYDYQVVKLKKDNLTTFNNMVEYFNSKRIN
jgi:hypothetical protein